MLGVIADALSDSVKLLPFLFLTYLAMEYIEHKAGSKMQGMIQKSGRFGPVFGSFLGAFPQCGFSTAASNLYAGRIITTGTLMAVFLSTSDEMLPVLISENVGLRVIFKILCVKIIIGMLIGSVIDIALRKWTKTEHEKLQIEHLCEHEHCHCEESIIKSALHHTVEIFLYILLISCILNGIIAFIGEDFLGSLFLNRPVVGELIAGLVGLIPNCASSVVLTQLYLEGVLSAGAMMSGLLAGSGIGAAVLLRVNDRRKENMAVIAALYITGVLSGLLIDVLGIVF
ncbi:MAG: arsenic efflux protein [Roseburia sp.]|nr:arsenic efflux protein [Roseburia sp.]MCM1243989.1 arsenic efflux protein [Roseburia sp.]